MSSASTFQFRPSSERRSIGRLFSVAFLIDVVEVGVGDDLEPAGNQRIVDLALTVEFLFIVVFLGQARFHLLEALVVHLGRVDVAADNLGAEGLWRSERRRRPLYWNGRNYRPGHRSSYTLRCLLQGLFWSGRTRVIVRKTKWLTEIPGVKERRMIALGQSGMQGEDRGATPRERSV